MGINSVLYILDKNQKVTGIASNHNPKSLPYFEDKLVESIETGVVTYEFGVPAKHPESEKLVANNHVVVRDLDGNFLLLTIKEVEESHEDGLLIKRVFCENTAVGEMLGQIVEPQTLPSATLSNAIKTIFKGVDEWSVLEIPYTKGQDVTIGEHMNLLEVLNMLAKQFEMELYFTVELSSVHIKKKIVRFVKKRGQKTDMRFEYGLNLTDVRRREDSTGIVTALYGVGKGDRDNSVSLKNYPHYDDKDFYHLAMTEWIGSRDALQRWGRNGKHIFGIYKSDTADTKEQLFKETLEELKRRNKPVLTYEASIATLERITGYEGQKVRIGDQVLVIDKTFKPAILLEARVVELQRSFTNPLDDAVKLGEYRPIKPSLSKLVGKLNSSMSNTVKYPDLPKIQQDFTDEVIKPIKNVVDELEEEVEETVQAVVNIDGLMKEVQDKVKAVEEDVQEREVKIYRQPTPPTNVPVDTLWINTDTNMMSRWDGTKWIEIAPELDGFALKEEVDEAIKKSDEAFNEAMSNKITEVNKEISAIDTKVTQLNTKVDADKQALETKVNEVASQTDIAIKQTEQKVSDLKTDVAKKVDATWVNGQLVSKANVGDSYTKKESDNALNTKVSVTKYDTDQKGVITRLDSAETRVTQAEDKIKLTATKDELKQSSDGLTSKINKINTDLTVQAGLIEGKVSNSTYTTDKTANETRFKNAESRIAQTEKDITAKVNATDVYKKTEIDPKLNAKVDTTTYNNKIASIEATNKSITQRVEDVNKTVTGLSVGGRNILLNSAFTTGNDWGGTFTVNPKDINGQNSVSLRRENTELTTRHQMAQRRIYLPETAKGTQYVASAWVYVDSTIPLSGSVSDAIDLRLMRKDNEKMYDTRIVDLNTLPKDTWIRVSSVVTLSVDVVGRYEFMLSLSKNGHVKMAMPQLELGNVVSDWQKAPEDVDAQINEKVNTTDFNKKVAEIKVTTDGITQSVSQVDQKVNGQETRLKSAESAIVQTNKEIGLKVNSTDVYTKTETDGKVNSKADKSSVYTKAETDGKVNAKVDTTVYNAKVAEIKATTDKITLNVSNVDKKVDEQGTRLATAESAITQTQKDIALKVNTTDVYKKTEIDPKLNAKVDNNTFNNKMAEIVATNNSITQKVEEVNKTVTGLSVGGRNLITDTAFWETTQLSSNSAYGVFKNNLNSIFSELLNETVTFSFDIKVTTTDKTAGRVQFYGENGSPKYTFVRQIFTGITDVYQRVTYTTKITEQPNNTGQARLEFWGIDAKTTKITIRNFKLERGNMASDYSKAPEDLDAQIDAKVNTEEYSAKVAEIKVTTDGISQTVSDVNKTVTAQGTRLSTAESAITQANTQIGLKVNATDVYKKTEIDPKLAAKVDTTTYNNKMAELKITTDNISQSVSSVTNKVDGMNIGGRNYVLNSGQPQTQKDFTNNKQVSNGYDLSPDFVPADLEDTFITISMDYQTTNLAYGTTSPWIGYQLSCRNASGTSFAWLDCAGNKSLPTGTSKGIQRWSNTHKLPKGTVSVVLTRVFRDFTGTVMLRNVKLETGNMATDYSIAPEDTNAAIDSKVDTATYTSKMSSIDTSISGITQRVTNTESSTSSLGSRMTTAEGKITTQAGQISSKVESTTYNTDMNGLKSRVSSAETFISQNKNNILLLAKADGVGSLLNQSPTGFKIAGRLLDIQGLVTFGTFDKATQDKINAINTSATNAQNTANTANSTANTAKTNAQTAQNTANTANSTANAVKTKTDNWTTNNTYIDGGKIYTNTITATQLNVNNIFANSAVVSAIKAYDLNADKIKAGTIKGIRYESINASNKTIKLVLEGNTVKSYGAMDTTLKKQNYAEMKDGGIFVFEMAESGSPFGDKKAYLEPARFNAVQGSRSSALEPTELRFWVPNMTGTLSYDVVPHNGAGYGLRLESLGGVHIKSTDNSQSALSFESKGAIFFDGFGNIKGDPYGSVGSTWSIKDGGGRVKFLVPVGKDATGSTDYYAHVGGHKFFHNGNLGVAVWTKGAEEALLQFAGNANLKYWKGGNYFEFKNGGDNGFIQVYASAFNTASSLVWKTDIQNYEKSALDVISSADIMTYKYKADVEERENPHTHIGIIAEYAPEEIQSQDGRGVDNYAMASLAWKAIQELNEQINELKAENVLLKGRLDGLNN